MSGLFFTLLPVLAFALLDLYSKNIKVAVYGAIICSSVELVALYISTGHVDFLTILAAFLFIFFGYLSVYFEDKRYFKIQPAVMGFIAGCVFSYFHFVGQSIAQRVMPILNKSAPASLAQYFQHPDFPDTLDKVFSIAILIVFLEAIWIAYAALFSRQSIWVFVNAFGIWILGASSMILWTVYLLVLQ